MADCPFCRKAIDSLATRCPYCRSEIQLTPGALAPPTFYSAVVAPALGAGLMSFVFWILSPFSGFVLHVALGGATGLALRDYMIGVGPMATIALVAVGLSALCGWLCQINDSVVLSLLSFFTPIVAPLVLVVCFQIATLSNSL